MPARTSLRLCWAVAVCASLLEPNEAKALISVDVQPGNVASVRVAENERMNVRIWQYTPLHVADRPAPDTQVVFKLLSGAFDVLALQARQRCRFGRQGGKKSGVRDLTTIICTRVEEVNVSSGSRNDLVCVIEPVRESFDERLNVSTMAGDDSITGGDARDVLSGGSDDDILLGGPGPDELLGLAAPINDDGERPFLDRDFLFGEEGGDRLWGGPFADILVGGAGIDLICGSDPTGVEVLSDCVDHQERDFGNNRLYGSEPYDLNLTTGAPFVPSLPAEFDGLDCGASISENFNDVRYDAGLDGVVNCPTKTNAQAEPPQTDLIYPIPSAIRTEPTCPPRAS